MKKITTRQLALSAAVAALYAALTYFSSIFGLAYGPVQIRFSEALTVLPFLFPSTVWGLFIGCLIANILSPYGMLDIVFGSLTTLLAAWCTSKMRRKWLAPLPPVIFNGLIIGALIAYTLISETGSAEGFMAAFAYNGLTIAAGELISCYVLGGIILIALPRIPFFRDMAAQERLG